MQCPRREPTSEECDTHAIVEHSGQKWMAAWYPQMGGYTSVCWVSIEKETDPEETPCFEAYVWHNGEFPFGDSDAFEEGNHIHHCSAEQFVRFGEAILAAQQKS